MRWRAPWPGIISVTSSSLPSKQENFKAREAALLQVPTGLTTQGCPSLSTQAKLSYQLIPHISKIGLSILSRNWSLSPHSLGHPLMNPSVRFRMILGEASRDLGSTSNSLCRRAIWWSPPFLVLTFHPNRISQKDTNNLWLGIFQQFLEIQLPCLEYTRALLSSNL